MTRMLDGRTGHRRHARTHISVCSYTYVNICAQFAIACWLACALVMPCVYPASPPHTLTNW